MKIFWTYFLLEYKKSIRVLAALFGSMLLMMGVTIAGTYLISTFLYQSQIFERISVGIVMPGEGEEATLIAQVVSAMDSVKSICYFEYLEEEEAREKLQSGEMQAAVILPEGLRKGIDEGVLAPVTVVLDNNISLNLEVFQELLLDGVSLIRTSEAAIYTVTDMAGRHEMSMSLGEVQYFISCLYIETAFSRNQVFQECILSGTGETDLFQYYFVAGISFFLLMCGLNFGFLYEYQSKIVEQKLKMYGINYWKAAVIKIAVMGSVLWFLAAFIYIAACALCSFSGSSFLFYDRVVLVGLLPEVLAVAAYFHMVYMVSGSAVQGGILLFILNAVMIICSGGIIPAVYLPQLVHKIGCFLPLTFWNQYMADIFYGKAFGLSALIEIAACVTFIIVGATVKWKNT